MSRLGRATAVLVLSLIGGCLVPSYRTDAIDTSTPNTPDACGADQKRCDGKCVEVDDPAYGCTPSSCNMSGCPQGSGAAVCKDGACVLGDCAAGSKKCGDTCVAINDPTYGCSDDQCDASACPDPQGGTLVCSGKTCTVGDCTGDTKKCGSKCVPLDENNGCAHPGSCEPCKSNEACSGTPSACTCVPDNVEACKGVACGPATNNCGESITCPDTCTAPLKCGSGASKNTCTCSGADPCAKIACGTVRDTCGQDIECPKTCSAETPLCKGIYCYECLSGSDCSAGYNECASATGCDEGNTCQFKTSGGSCRAGQCSTTEPGLCERAPVTAGGITIDPAEITRAQYGKFYFAVNDYTGQPPACAWNDSYQPLQPFPGAMRDADKPVVGVDWCDAYMYCKWTGRRLCGKIGGGSVPFDSFSDPKVSQWTHVCEGASNQAYPYGTSFDSFKCNTPPRSTGIYYAAMGLFGAESQCVGGYPGVYDMSGNVAEWEDACQPAADGSELCHVRGGSAAAADDAASASSCAAPATAARNAKDPNIGFRCCGP